MNSTAALRRALAGGIACIAVVTGAQTAAVAQDPTPIPVVPIARITSPIKSQQTRGTVVIQGAATSPNFQRFEIAYALEPAGEPWTIIGGSTTPIPGGTLQSWNTRPLPDGDYILRLQVFNTDSTVFETRVTGVKLTNQALANGQAAIAPGAVITRPSAVNTEIDTARRTLDQLNSAITRAPAAFTRGVRLALYALAGVVAYGLLRQLAFWLWKRYVRRTIDYGR
jgi:hypothetical protein